MGNIQKEEIMVSVDMITYNHEKFISQAIEGVLMQKTNFRYELVIGEDCSSDNTSNIVKAYARKYPDIIKARCNSINLGMTANGLMTVQECKGKYMAICEGDDYWTDPYKLQKQVDFLEGNPDYGLVHTDFDRLDYKTNKRINSFYKSNNIDIFSGNILFDYQKRGFIRLVTVCIRKQIVKDFLRLYQRKMIDQNWLSGDLPLFLYAAYCSKIEFLPESTSVYRRLPESASSSKDFKRKLDFLDSSYDVLFFFIKEFSMGEEIYNSTRLNFLRSRLGYLYDLRRIGEIRESAHYLKSVNLKFNELVILWGSKNTVNYYISKVLLSVDINYNKVKRYIKRIYKTNRIIKTNL